MLCIGLFLCIFEMKTIKDLFNKVTVCIKFPDNPYKTLEIINDFEKDIIRTINNDSFEITRKNLSKYRTLIKNCCENYLDIVCFRTNQSIFYFEDGEAYMRTKGTMTPIKIDNITKWDIDCLFIPELLGLIKRGYFGESIETLPELIRKKVRELIRP